MRIQTYAVSRPDGRFPGETAAPQWGRSRARSRVLLTRFPAPASVGLDGTRFRQGLTSSAALRDPRSPGSPGLQALNRGGSGRGPVLAAIGQNALHCDAHQLLAKRRTPGTSRPRGLRGQHLGVSLITWCSSDALSTEVTGLPARSEGTNSGAIVPPTESRSTPASGSNYGEGAGTSGNRTLSESSGHGRTTQNSEGIEFSGAIQQRRNRLHPSRAKGCSGGE
jgi:hypothetical protein